jgi:translation elongation factor P/translation initiation factor 5A
MSRRARRRAKKTSAVSAVSAVSAAPTSTPTSSQNDDWSSATFSTSTFTKSAPVKSEAQSPVVETMPPTPTPAAPTPAAPTPAAPTPAAPTPAAPTPTQIPPKETISINTKPSKSSKKKKKSSKAIKTTRNSAVKSKPVLLDVESMEKDELFELPTSALSLTMRGAPKYIMLKDQPCKIADARMKKKATNRGNDRIEIKGLHIVTGKLYQDTIVGTVLVPVLKVKFKQYTLLDVDISDGSVSLMDDDGALKEDAVLMKSPDSLNQFDTVGMQLIERNNNGEELLVTVFSALGRDVVVEFKKDDTKDGLVDGKIL